jgi:DNA-binding MarR family transcriptional regulator
MVTKRQSATPSRMPAGAMLHLDNQLCFALYSSSLTMTKLYKPVLDKLGLTYPQYLVMLALWERDGLTVSELGERLFLDSGTLTPLLKRMETSGLVQRERAREDERRVIVSLSPAGRRMKEGAHAVPEEILCATQCSLEEVIELTQRLHRLRKSLAQHLEPGLVAAKSA